MGELFGELAEEDPAIAKHHVSAVEDVGDQPRNATRFDGQGLHALGMPWGNDQTGLLARNAHGADGEDFGHKARSAHISSRVDAQGPEQRAKGFRLPQHCFAVETYADEVVHRLDVVLFEGLPGRAQDVALLRRQAPPFGQIFNAAFDLGPQAFELGRWRNQRTRIPRECRLQRGGIQKRHALHPALLTHQPARNLSASHRSLVFEPDHVID